MNTKNQEIYFFALLLGFAAALFYFILKPFLNVLILAGVFAIAFQPLHRNILKLFGRWRGFAAAFTALIILLIILIPLALIGFQIFIEAQNLYATLTEPEGTTLHYIEDLFSAYVYPVSGSISFDLNEYVRQFVGQLAQNLGSVFSGVTRIALGIFLTLLALYYFLKDGEGFIAYLTHLSPLRDEYDHEILKRIELTVNSVVRGSLTVAAAQGTVAGIGFFLFGVPQAALWGMLAVIAALIPVIGTALVVVPAVLYLVFNQNVAAAIGLVIWGVLLVGLVDNILRPQLMRRSVNIHPFLILLAVLGGLQFFGPIGFLIGPVILSLLFVLLDIYPRLVIKADTSR